LENFLAAWREFKRGKTLKLDVLDFEHNLEDNIWQLHRELAARTYRPDPYVSFYITDPKLRHIHKASVRDRVLHQAIYRVLYPIFDRHFIFDSYSSRRGKGTHRGVKRLADFARRLSGNYRKTTYCLKCDVRKFFDSVDQEILISLIEKRIFDEDLFRLIKTIIKSFSKASGKGLPLGNVTSQLFSNIYLNELDQFIKHQLKAKCYIRYCDDFAILDNNRQYLESLLEPIRCFLSEILKLDLHPNKVSIGKFCQGFDFLGYVVLPHHIVWRTGTQRRSFKKLSEKKKMLDDGLISEEKFDASLQSYLGILKHCNGHKIEKRIRESYN